VSTLKVIDGSAAKLFRTGMGCCDLLLPEMDKTTPSTNMTPALGPKHGAAPKSEPGQE